MKKYLDEEEVEILQLHKSEKLVVSEGSPIEIIKATKAAKNAFKKKAVLNIKLSDRDLNNLKLKEIEMGVPYQNIVSALIHKYLDNKIKLTL